jgi:hypothetical protein
LKESEENSSKSKSNLDDRIHNLINENKILRETIEASRNGEEG